MLPLKDEGRFHPMNDQRPMFILFTLPYGKPLRV